MRDTTERVRAEEELKQYRDRLEQLVEQRSGELLRTNEQLRQEIARREKVEEQLRFQAFVLSHVSDAVVAVDIQQRIIYWNQAAERLYHFSTDEVLGRPQAEVTQYRWLQPEDKQSAFDALATTGSWRGELIHLKKNGEKIGVAQ
ncbi:PAS domain-containing protein [Kamptonema formosum]|uniref:PAS domain-containing protein n=1 Tax=Kamptonema formosum TaxID=331992 RepID=UPI00034D3035|nr:PAS domain-containing protein [Oscillatoria sp. PCC 10802]